MKKNLKDGDSKKLSKRIESTIRFLKEDLFDQLKKSGYVKAAAFVKSHARFMVTFAWREARNTDSNRWLNSTQELVK
ncbi:MAG: hypothetical protein ACYC7D_15220 [Nitrososphaerales archaeon]